MLIIWLKLLILLPYLIIMAIIDQKKQKLRLYGIYGFFGLPRIWQNNGNE